MIHIEQAIKEAVEKIAAFPKRDIIRQWFRGIKENVLRQYENVRLARLLTDVYSSTTGTSSATATTTTFDATAVSSAIQKLAADSEHLSQSGLAADLGITREGVQRLIWLCADAQDTSNGSKTYSEETITRVKNALYAERILKQTTFRFASPQSLMKNELLPTKQQWRVNGYGISPTVARSVVNAIAT
jgi:hypothetical protein